MWNLCKLTSFYNGRYILERTSKTRKQFVIADTYLCYYKSTVIWIFYMGIKFRVLLISRFFYNRETCEITEVLIRLPRTTWHDLFSLKQVNTVFRECDHFLCLILEGSQVPGICLPDFLRSRSWHLPFVELFFNLGRKNCSKEILEL